MTATTTVTTVLTKAAGAIGIVLMLALPLVLAQAQETGAPRTIEVKASRFAFSPERIELELGERVRLNVVSLDSAHGFRVKELGLNVRTLVRGKTVTVEVTATKVGTFEVSCSEYCGSGHRRMKGLLVVTPGK